MKIPELFIFLASPETNPPYNEGLVMGDIPLMGKQPLVTAHRRVADLLIPQLREVSNLTGKQIQLVRFARAEEIEWVTRRH